MHSHPEKARLFYFLFYAKQCPFKIFPAFVISALHALLLQASPAVSFSPLSHESLYKPVSLIYLLSLDSQKTLTTWFVIPGTLCDHNVLLMHNQLLPRQLFPFNNSLSSHIHSLSIYSLDFSRALQSHPSSCFNSCFPKLQGIYKVLWGTVRCYPAQNSLETFFFLL